MNQKEIISFVIALFLITNALAQPYLDVLNIRYTNSPGAGLINQKKNSLSLSYLNISTTLPLVLKNEDAIIISPYFEKWQLNLPEKVHHYYGFILPLSYLKQLNKNWSLLVTAIARVNDSAIHFTMRRQAGGALIFNYKQNSQLTFKGGAYFNREFFGSFFMPLAGIDWQINSKDALFGMLPGNLTYQHKVSQYLAYGFTFRAQTNSYNRSGSYMRIDENQLGAFMDIYLRKQIVLNMEAGHSLFRKIRSKNNLVCGCDGKYKEYNVNDNVYVKLSAAYRISLRDK